MEYNKSAYIRLVNGTLPGPTEYVREMRGLANTLIALQEDEMLPPKIKWPQHLQQFSDFEATSGYLLRAYKDFFPEYKRFNPDKLDNIVPGWTLGEHGPSEIISPPRRPPLRT